MDLHEPAVLPFVSVVIPVYNEERYIQACLNSVLEQDYPRDRYEVIVADGGSTDRTRTIVEAFTATHPNVRLIDNPRRTQASGLNLGIRASRGEYIARQDGHAEWGPRHLRRSIELLVATGADNVGGRADGAGSGATGRAIARAMRSPFGVGGARFRYSTKVEDAATVFPGTFRRTALERVGLFDEAYPPHEDYELNHRIRESGGRVLFSPEIPTRYHVRESVSTLARQYFRYGRAKVRVARASPAVIRPYHLAAPSLVAAVPVLALCVVTGRGRRSAVGVGALYAAVCVAAGVRAGAGEPAAVRLRIPGVFVVMHVAWGSGFWVGIGEAMLHRDTGGGAPPRLPSQIRT
jgi:cellulose synthase/poly-beta-1,6-N-acetylglucosamine synthase-like glycosyltransferase